MKAIGFETHDHSTCIADAVAAVEERCRDEGLKLTPQRRRVLELLLDHHRALGAYDILDLLRAEGKPAQPPVAYRALNFLVRHGFVHKIERLNAFVACSQPQTDHSPAFMICRDCQSVAETHTVLSTGHLAKAAKATGFAVEQIVVEAEGLCPACQEPSA